MRWIARLAPLAGFLWLAAGGAQAQTVKYLNQLSGAATVAGANTLPLCQTSGGCGSGNPIVSATVSQLNTYFQSQISATAPLTFNSGVIAFASQSALTVLAGPASGSAAPPAFALLSAPYMPATTPAYKTGAYPIAATDLNNPVCLSGSGVSGNTTFTLPQAGTTGFAAGTVYVVCNLNATYSLAVTTTTSAFLGPNLATTPLTQNQWAMLYSDGTNWLVLER